MAQRLTAFLRKYISPELVVFIISMLPILELRGGILAASILDLPWFKAAIICIIGNIIPVPFIILLIERILKFLKDHGPIKKLATVIWDKGTTQGARMMEKYPQRIQLGLFLFVAIPLPGTGAWTGSLIAALLGISPKRSAPVICLGVLSACVIMLGLCYLFPSVFQNVFHLNLGAAT